MHSLFKLSLLILILIFIADSKVSSVPQQASYTNTEPYGYQGNIEIVQPQPFYPYNYLPNQNPFPGQEEADEIYQSNLNSDR